MVAALILLDPPSTLLVRTFLRQLLDEGLALLLFCLFASFRVGAIVVIVARFVVVPRARVHDALHESAGVALHHGSTVPEIRLIRVGQVQDLARRTSPVDAPAEIGLGG